MNRQFAPLLVALATTLLTATAQAAGTAHSLDQAASKLKTPEARAAFNQDMGNTPEPDGFGTHLPAGFTKQAVIAQVAPGQDAARAVLVGVKPWPQRANAYVAIVCVATTDKIAKEETEFRPAQQCDGVDSTSDNPTASQDLVWLGVFERGTDGAPKLIARTEQPLDHGVDWDATNLQAPDNLPADSGKGGSLPEQWLRFDLAPYQLRAGDYAFGVRAGWSVSYSGGGGDFEALYLYRIDGAAIRLVFAQPMMYYRNIAGDWHKDGTRDHDIEDGSNTLSVLPTATNGFRDWQLRQHGGKWRKTFQWSAQDGAYVSR
ncbi:hypothetical protein [Trinickia dinghuensis]|uniref:Secreted protein n=1 Tax=Trinickia dinghuensis TaxID=2291023 RepID=A0A3D8K0Q4_9BURK|nr:hypothetical protein [Trinickia dinghuensis]RDU98191.1 hypothetical protein DWV00_12735 [Trinickia dinghuensis]